MGERVLTVRDKIVVHLSAYNKYAEDFECPGEMCQSGISAAIGKSRAHVTLELKRMMDAGLLHERIAHVKGGKSKRKTYTLTAQGAARNAEIARHLESLSIDVTDDGKKRTLNGAEAALCLSRTRGIPHVTAVCNVMSCGGKLDLGPQKASDDATYIGRLSPTPDDYRPCGDIEHLAGLLRDGRVSVAAVMGLPGAGKTAALMWLARNLGDSRVMYRRIYSFDSLSSVLDSLALFLAENGFPALRSYLERNGSGDLPEAGAHIKLCLGSGRFVLMFDDQDLAPAGVRPLFSMLLELVRGSGSVLVVACAGKPDFYSVRDVALEKDVVEVAVAPLDDAAATKLFTDEAGMAPSNDVLKLANGHPLTLRLLASGISPAGLSDMVTDEMLGKNDDLARLCRFASVLRKPFELDDLGLFGFVAAASAGKNPVFERQPAGGCLLHPAISAILRASVSERMLRSLHVTASEFYAAAGGQNTEVLHHLLEAGEVRKAAELALRESAQFLASNDPDELADSMEKLLRAGDCPIELVMLASSALNQAGRWDRALELAESVVAGAPSADTALRAMVLESKIMVKRGQFGEALALLEAVLGNDGNIEKGLAAEAHFVMTSILRMLGKDASALEHCEAAVAAAHASGDGRLEAMAIMEWGLVLNADGKHAEALEKLQAAQISLSKSGGDRDRIRCGINIGLVLASLGRKEEAAEELEKAIALAESAGLYRLKAYGMTDLADILNSKGEHAKAAKLAGEAVKIFSGLGEPLMLAASQFNLGIAHAGMGRKDEAIASLDGSIDLLREHGLLGSRVEWLREYASVLKGMGEPRKAAGVLRMAQKPNR